MNLLIVMVLILFFIFTFPPRTESSEISIQSVSLLKNQEIVGDSIRHGKKRKKNKNGLGRGKKGRKLKNSTTRRFVEKQYLVHNRTLALLGDDVQKILLNSRGLPELLERRPDDRLRKLLSSPVLIGLKIGREREGGGPEYDTTSEGSTQAGKYSAVLARIIGQLAEILPAASSSETNPCHKWLECRGSMEEVFLGPLPSCPCIYPSEIFYDDKVWDNELQRYYQWRDVSGESDRLDIYKPGAEYCIRSRLADGSTSLAAQHCCYDRERKLITRGSGAGSPNYVSPDVSQQLHEKIDLMPWKLCKGDFTRYNKIRPPNNGNQCAENPKDDIYEKQVRLAKFY